MSETVGHSAFTAYPSDPNMLQYRINELEARIKEQNRLLRTICKCRQISHAKQLIKEALQK